MRIQIIALLITITLVHASARGYGQKISLNEKNTPVEKILSSIKKQSGYVFFYDDNDLKNTRISININNADIKQVLDLCFRNLPLTYTVEQKTIVISQKTESASPKATLLTDTVQVNGRVFGENGKALAGASILDKADKLETATDANGGFTLGKVKNKNVVIEISYVGYITRKIKANDKMDKIVLEVKTNELDETHVIAYGTESRRLSVGSTASISAADIEKQPVTNVLLALQGQVPGLDVTTASGVPGAQVKLQIRGQNTLGNSIIRNPYDQPLFIIDGVQFAPQNTNINNLNSLANNDNTNPSGLSPFNGINPNDIESVSILKDADATSIYGSQGANGVIIITTKKGKPGKTALNFSTQTGYNFDASPLKLLNTQQYIALRQEAFKNDGLVPSGNPNNQFNANYAPDLTIYDQNKYTNFNKVLFGKTSNTTDVHGSLSGGTIDNTFIVSTGYTKSDYDFPGNFADNRLTLHTGFHHTSPDKRLTLDFGTDYSYDRNNSAASLAATTDITLPPNLPNLLDPSGNLVFNYKGVDLGNSQFYGYLKQPTLLQAYNLNNSLKVGYKIVKGLTLSANLGYSRVSTAEQKEIPKSSQDPIYASSSASFANYSYQTITVEPQLNYERTDGKGVFSALVGGSYKKNINDLITLSGYNYSSDALLGSISGAGSQFSYNNSIQYRYAAIFGRLKYIYDQEYIISLTANRDGSSNFGPGHQFGNFGSAGLGWIFSQEDVFKQALPFISYAKISGNYGTSGSDAISPYQYQSFWQPEGYIPTFQGTRPYQVQNLYNPDYSWGVKKTLNLGMDLGFFNDRLLVNATYYLNREGNQLISYSLPIQTGFSTVVENLNATVQNKGWEFTLSSTNIKTKDFKWTTSFNISANRNKLLAFPGLSESSFASNYIIGKSTSTVQGYKYKDVNPTTGVFEFYTADGKVTDNPNENLASRGGDVVPIADLQPKFFGGFGNNLSYKNFALSFFFQFSKSTALNYLYELYNNYTPGLMANVPTQVLGNYWKNPGYHAQLEKLTADPNSDASYAGYNFTTSSGAYSDDTYLRLKTLALSYTLPNSFLKKLNITNCKVYVNAQNLLTITDYKVGDPEQPGSYTGFPIQRTLVFGLSFNL